MERVFNDHNCKISSILKSVNLEHLHPKLIQKCVTLDTFLNLKDEDLDYLEITDPNERDILLNNFNLYRDHFKDVLAPSKLDRHKMLLSNLQQLNAINSLTSTIINEMVNQQAMESCCNRLVDDVTPVSKIIDLFCTHSLNSLQLIESDIKQELDRYDGISKNRWRSRAWSIGLFAGCLSVCLPLVGLLLWNHIKPVLRS